MTDFWIILQIKHKPDGTFQNVVMSKDTEAEAIQYFYATLSTYAFNQTFDYVSCMILLPDGRVFKREVIDRREANADY